MSTAGHDPDVAIRSVAGADEYSRLVDIWRSAVEATHDFLAREHRDDIESHLASDYFPQVDLFVAERRGHAVGFVGTSETNLEMLFVDARSRGQGIGRALLLHVVRELGVTTVDVNEQNEQAVGFYRHQGFRVVSRSDRDDQGRPYPLLHMHIEEAASAGRGDART